MTAAGSCWNSSWEPLYLKNSKLTALETEWVLFPLPEKVLFNVQGQCLFLCMTHMDTLIYSTDALFQNSTYFELTMGALIWKLVKLHHFVSRVRCVSFIPSGNPYSSSTRDMAKHFKQLLENQFSFFVTRSDFHRNSHFLGTKEWHAGCYWKQEQDKKKMQSVCSPTKWKTVTGIDLLFF